MRTFLASAPPLREVTAAIPSLGPDHFTLRGLTASGARQSEALANPGIIVDRGSRLTGDIGSIPGPEGYHLPWSNKARAPQLLSMCPGAGEPRLLKPVHLVPAVRNKKRRCRDADTRHNSRAAPLTETRRARAATKTQHAQKQAVVSSFVPRALPGPILASGSGDHREWSQ
ncbi:hypothetical protein MJT46_006390 [Ovis ammon polii x Ovis aries]|nr:hypothetical protein MJT46_006390 [Ovis ammon polii x Ovis aries]